MLVEARGNPHPLASNGDLRNPDGNSNGSVQNRIGFVKTTTLSVHQAFFVNFFAVPAQIPLVENRNGKMACLVLNLLIHNIIVNVSTCVEASFDR